MPRPKFVRLAALSQCALRWDGEKYYRDAGNWGMPAEYDSEGTLRMVSSMQHLNGLALISTTFEDWKEDNGRYAPKGIKE